ncbi:MAG: hypothetical protein N2712_02310 [Brevinematales bacterium]|nr:hypothetical protein [Brevinematales bacterium]
MRLRILRSFRVKNVSSGGKFYTLIVDNGCLFYDNFNMSYTPLDVKTVIFADNLLMKNSVNNPAYASALQSQAKIQMKEKSEIEQNRTADVVEISREGEKIRRRNLGEDNAKNKEYQFQNSKNGSRKEKTEIIVENGEGNNIDIIV